MARRPEGNGGAPVSLHVVSRPTGAPVDDEERTTLDANGERKKQAAAEWEDGTTVEESTLAEDRFRTPFAIDGKGNTTHTTGTENNTIDELTVEEQARPVAALQLVQAAEPAHAALSTATLVCTSGSDTGREFPVVAGKVITIGRGIDNDVVLTDISVSRKHFDLEYGRNRWVLRDRGSGNGTLINNRMEDGSCELVHGDRIEIGNTAFRFDHLTSSVQSAQGDWGSDDARTVAGKAPGRDGDPGRSGGSPGPIAKPATTLPGPPPGARHDSGRGLPAPGRGRTSSGPVAGGVMPGLSPSPPGVTGPNAPTLGPGGSPQMYPVVAAGPSAPTMAPLRLGEAPTMSEYPSASPADLAGLARYPVSSPHQPSIEAPPPVIAPPPQRTSGSNWLVMGSVIILVTSIGIGAAATDSSAAQSPPAQIIIPKLTRPVFAKRAPSVVAVDDAPPTGPIVEPIELDPDAKPDLIPAEQAAAQGQADQLAAAQAQADADATAQAETAAAAAAAKAQADQLATAQAAAAKAQSDQLATAQAAQRKADQRLADQRAADQRAADQRRDGKKADAEKRRIADERRAAERRAVAENKAERERKARANRESRPRVAVAGVDAARTKAASQYRAADFGSAANTLTAAAKGADAGVADDLRSGAADYKAIGAGITAGRTEASSKPVDTLAKLKKALAADRRAGGAHGGTIRDMLTTTAPRAAVSQMAKGNLEGAHAATVDAVNNGAGNDSSVKSVRKTLESRAAELYSQASKAKDRAGLQRILKIVPKDSIWHQKATKALQK